MANSHGKSSAIYHDITALTGRLSDLTITHTSDSVETSAFGDSAKTYIAGMTDGTVTVSGYFDGAASQIDSVLAADVAGTAIISILPEGTAVGKDAIVLSSLETSYEIGSSIGGAVTVAAEYQPSGGVSEFGGTVHYNAAITSAATTTGTSQDFRTVSNNTNTSTAKGGRANLHISANTWSGATDVKIEHSANDSTWADLITFTQVGASTTSAQTGLTATTTTTVNRYTRANIVTASGSGSVTVLVTFARGQ